MVVKKEGEIAGRKEWTQPELKKLEAGAAESGNRLNEDGNTDALSPRS